jgi:hypothetical protein
VKVAAWIVGLSLVAATAVAQQKPEPPKTEKEPKETKQQKELREALGKLKFMAGCWEAPMDKESVVQEIWTTPADNLMLATTRVVKKGRAIEYEFTRIAATDSGLVFAASSDGKPFDEYLMKTQVDEYVVFENLKKSFPQRIIYRLASDGALIPRNEGEGQPSFEVRMKKFKCPGE